jgi:protein O-mannosyl-transferase
MLAALLAGVTLAVYAPTWWYPAVSFDDPSYVIDNYHVTAGLTPQNIVWSFTSFYDANWIPLTWLSLMLDVDLFGGGAGGFHLTNTLLHAACAVFLFLALARATGSDLRSAFVAGLFALHPLHVESVAWIAERKDVLSIFFGLLSLWTYVRYAQGAGRINLAIAFVCLALSLMAKQTLVTLPFVFLLLDYWPLRRLAGPQPTTTSEKSRRTTGQPKIGPLILEKLPLFGLSIAFSIVATVAQARGGAVMQAVPLGARLINAVFAYGAYLWKTLIPIRLAVYYPHPSVGIPWLSVAISAVVLLGASIVALAGWRRLPYLFVGWFWYLGTLVPMIGLVQIGGQQMADRYTYFPLIGIFLAVTWLAAEAIPIGVLRTRLLPTAAIVVLVGCAALSFRQIGYWHDAVSLFEQTVAVNPENPTPYEYLGDAQVYTGHPDKAIPEYEEAVRRAPPYAPLEFKLAGALAKSGRNREAIQHYQAALALDEKSAQAHNDFAVLLMSLQQDAAAKSQLDRALELDPNLAKAQANLSLLCAKHRDYAAAIRHGERALEIDPKQIDCYHYIAVALRGQGKFDEAIAQLEQLIKIAPDYEVARKELEITRAMRARRR